MSSHELIVVFGLMIWFALVAGVTFDAYKRDRSPMVWGVVTFFFGFAGAFVYAAVLLTEDSYPDDPDTILRCANCSSVYVEEKEFCENCGESLDDAERKETAGLLQSGRQTFCDNCKTEVERDMNVCEGCDRIFVSRLDL